MTAALTGVDGARTYPTTVRTVANLCAELERAGVRYCHWKSNNALDRSAAALNDLDLLVARADSLKFAGVLAKCGFKLAHAPARKRMPGVVDYFTFDAMADKWVHVHAHYQMVVGHDLTKNYRLPVEEPYLDSAVRYDCFKLPAPEFEFVVFVIRMTLKHSAWDAILAREGRLNAAERREFLALRSAAAQNRTEAVLTGYFPYISRAHFWRSVDTLRPESSVWARLRTGYELELALRAYRRRGIAADAVLRVVRRLLSPIRRRVAAPERYQLGTGGAAIALVGADGAGKSAAVEAMCGWFSSHFATTNAHLGKPAWSRLTTVVRGVLKLGHVLRLFGPEVSVEETLEAKSLVSPGYAFMLREACRARDRYRTYATAMQHASRGGIVVFDRFPLHQVELMDGPLTRRFLRDLAASPEANRFLSPKRDHRLAKWLVRLEEDYYKRIVAPRRLIVLRVDPETAVRRKPEEHPAFIRQRAEEIWTLNCQQTGAHVVDANMGKADVHTFLKEIVWSRL